jgi:hypothetical protein
VQADVDAAVVVEGVTGVGPARMRADRALEAAWIVRVPEVVVTPSVGTQLRVVVVGGERERGPLCQRPTIFAPRTASSLRLAALSRRYWR